MSYTLPPTLAICILILVPTPFHSLPQVSNLTILATNQRNINFIFLTFSSHIFFRRAQRSCGVLSLFQTAMWSRCFRYTVSRPCTRHVLSKPCRVPLQILPSLTQRPFSHPRVSKINKAFKSTDSKISHHVETDSTKLKTSDLNSLNVLSTTGHTDFKYPFRFLFDVASVPLCFGVSAYLCQPNMSEASHFAGDVLIFLGYLTGFALLCDMMIRFGCFGFVIMLLLLVFLCSLLPE